ISELGFTGIAVGAALTGLKPIVEFQFSDFILLVLYQIVNQAAKIHYMFGGKESVSLVILAPGGSGTGSVAQDSQSLAALLTHILVLKVIQRSTSYDV